MMAMDGAALTHLFNQQQDQRFVFHRQSHTAQAFSPRPWFITVLLVVRCQRIKDFPLPARCNGSIQQTVSRLNKAMQLNQRTHTVAVELTRPGEVRNIHRPARQM